jgi:hypothetical protein
MGFEYSLMKPMTSLFLLSTLITCGTKNPCLARQLLISLERRARRVHCSTGHYEHEEKSVRNNYCPISSEIYNCWTDSLRSWSSHSVPWGLQSFQPLAVTKGEKDW